MRMLGLTSIAVAAGLALAGPAAAQTPAPEPAPTVSAGTAAAPANVTAPADPLVDANGVPLAAPKAGVGQPVDGSIAIQDQVTKTGVEARDFHNWILLPLITAISLFVLGLLLWVIVFYRRAANPEPSRTSHNTFIEIVWTLVPVLILVAIAVPSIRLLAHQYRPAPDGAVTLKAIGNQWYWSYEYPDHGIQLTANLLRERDEVSPGQRYRTDADGPRLLATDQRVVLPVGVPIRLIATAQDVIHAWAIPAFWVKIDAVPGRLNETSFTIDRPGIYYGQCSELCGQRHGYMPIVVEAVSPEVFAQWVAARDGTMPGTGEDAANGSVPLPGNDTTDETAPDNAAGPVVNATEVPVTNQADTDGNAGAGN